MVDISDDESIYEDFVIDTNNEVKPLEFKTPSTPSNKSYSASSESKSMLNPNHLSFMNKIRKRTAKEREKESDRSDSNKITTDLIDKIHNNMYKIPFGKPTKKEKPANDDKRLEDLIFKKFHDRKSISKIVQKTAKLQKNIDTKM